MKKMASFITLFLLLPCIVLGILLFWGFGLPAQYEETFLGEMKYKMDRLKETASLSEASSPPAASRRVILVGGSSIPFGFKTALATEALPDLTFVDFGMYADMGTVVMLDWLRPYIKEGDLILLCPEQNAQSLSCRFSGEDVWQAADGDFTLAASLLPKHFEKLAASFPGFAGKKCFYALFGSPQPTDIYARASFDSYGDISYPDRNANIMPLLYNPNDTISFSTDVITEDFLSEMNDFAAFAKECGAQVYYRFSPMNALALSPDTESAAIDAYYDYLSGVLDFPILGNPHQSIMDGGWFYDTNFHLNDSGAVLFTKYLVEDLKLLYKDTSLTGISVPDMPAPALADASGEAVEAPLSPASDTPIKFPSASGSFKETSEGAVPESLDTAMEKYYVYEKNEAENGYLITGLTQEGAKASVLSLPATIQGKPVTDLSPSLFSQAASLEELTVPAGFTLYDGMFAGCKSFRHLILTAPSPSSYIIGDHLLEGADFLIYVPADALDTYQRNYSWQKYSQRITAIP